MPPFDGALANPPKKRPARGPPRHQLAELDLVAGASRRARRCPRRRRPRGRARPGRRPSSRRCRDRSASRRRRCRTRGSSPRRPARAAARAARPAGRRRPAARRPRAAAHGRDLAVGVDHRGVGVELARPCSASSSANGSRKFRSCSISSLGSAMRICVPGIAARRTARRQSRVNRLELAGLDLAVDLLRDLLGAQRRHLAGLDLALDLALAEAAELQDLEHEHQVEARRQRDQPRTPRSRAPSRRSACRRPRSTARSASPAPAPPATASTRTGRAPSGAGRSRCSRSGGGSAIGPRSTRAAGT